MVCLLWLLCFLLLLFLLFFLEVKPFLFQDFLYFLLLFIFSLGTDLTKAVVLEPGSGGLFKDLLFIRRCLTLSIPVLVAI